MYFGEMAADIQELASILDRKATRRDVESLTWTLGLMGRTFSAGHFVRSLREWDIAARQMGRFHETYDLYLTPTVAFPPVRIGELAPKPAERTAMNVINALGLGKLLQLSGITDKLAIESLSKTPFTSSRISPACRPCPCRCTGRPTTCPAASSSSGASGTRPPSSDWPPSSKRPGPGSTAARRRRDPPERPPASRPQERQRPRSRYRLRGLPVSTPVIG